MKRAIAIIISIIMIMAVTFPASAISTVAIKEIKLEKNKIIIKSGQTYSLKVQFTPADTTQKQLKYVTSNQNVAMVDKRGRIIGVNAGSATITVLSAADEKISEKFYVTVTKDKVKITMCMNNTGWGGLAIDPDLMNETVSQIEDNTGTSITVIAPPIGSYPDKLNVLLASGQIPDIFAVTKATDNIQVYASRGYTMQLDELIKATPEITSMVDEKYFDYLTVGGKLVGLPMYQPQSKVIWLRKDLMTRYGIKLSNTPTTEEFFTEMSKAVGKSIPFCFAKFVDNMPFFFNPFGGYYGIGIKDGKAYDGFNTQGAKDALAYVAKLYKAKVWDQEFLTNENQTMREKLFTGKAVSALDYTNRYIYYGVEAEKSGNPTDYFPIYELKGPKGIGGNLNEAIQDAICISAKTKVPEAAMNIMKYYFFTEEGVLLRNVGVKGKHYTLNSSGIITPTAKATGSGYVANLSAFYMYFPQVKDFGFKWDAISNRYTQQQLNIIAEAPKHLGPKFLIDSAKSDLYAKNLAGYKKKLDEVTSKVMMGGMTIEKAYDDYEAYWKSIKGDDMLAQLNK